MKIENIICLGDTCQTRWHLQKYSLKTRGSDFSQNYFFDWLWRNKGVQGLIEWLKNDLIVEESLFSVRKVADHHEVYCERYGYYFTHDIEMSNCDNETALKIYAEHKADFLIKKIYLAKKIINSIKNSDNLIFAHAGEISDNDLNELRSVIGSIRGKMTSKYLLFEYNKFDEIVCDDSNVLRLGIIKKEWPGDADSWSRAWEKADKSFIY